MLELLLFVLLFASQVAALRCFWLVVKLRQQRTTLESVIESLLAGYDPDLDADAWVKILWSYSGDHEREGGPMSPDERAVVLRLMPPKQTGT